MNVKYLLSLAATILAGSLTASTPSISGDYLEVRSCDIYTGSCVANSQMNLAGREGMLVWSVREGSWKGTALDGLSVIAVVRTDSTLGDQHFFPRDGKAVIIVDAKANVEQRAALLDFVKSTAGKLVQEIVEVKTSPVSVDLKSACSSGACAVIKAGNLVEINTRCLGGKDHLCGNEETYYPPLTVVEHATPAFTEVASYKGNGLGMTWESTSQRSAFLASFSR
jgi:hypothetical protein